jgi:mRNA-degrading endonuclease RelE of RelBE toxin-antitoxin system
MATYEIRFVTEAARQRDALPAAARRELEEALSALRENPFAQGTKGKDEVWYRDFGRTGQIMYLVSNRIATVTVLRLTYV